MQKPQRAKGSGQGGKGDWSQGSGVRNVRGQECPQRVRGFGRFTIAFWLESAWCLLLQVEVLPTACVLFILRKLPPKRTHNQVAQASVSGSVCISPTTVKELTGTQSLEGSLPVPVGLLGNLCLLSHSSCYAAKNSKAYLLGTLSLLTPTIVETGTAATCLGPLH